MPKGVCYFQVVQSGGKNIELAVMRKGETLKVISKAPCKWMQHCWPTTPNIVGCYMLCPFVHHVVVYIINRTLHGRLEIRNFSSRVETKFHSFAVLTLEVF